VTVENYAEYTDIEIGIDTDTPIKLGSNTSIIFRDVSIQPHLIKIQASRQDKSIVSFSKNIDVSADKTTEVTLTLP
jgi:hypothetical protein